MSISLFTFLLGVFGAGAFGHFEQSALDIRLQQLELTVGVSSQRLAESEKRQLEIESHLEANDKQMQEMMIRIARQQRDLGR